MYPPINEIITGVLCFLMGYSFRALVLTKGLDALMGQLDYDDIEFVKEHPAVYKRAIELGILTEEE